MLLLLLFFLCSLWKLLSPFCLLLAFFAFFEL